eukprot:6403277-Amphidinium_carterae.1
MISVGDSVAWYGLCVWGSCVGLPTLNYAWLSAFSLEREGPRLLTMPSPCLHWGAKKCTKWYGRSPCGY